MQRRAETLPPSERVQELVMIASLATERLRDRELIRALWSDVLAADPTNADARSRLDELASGADVEGSGGTRWIAAALVVAVAIGIWIFLRG